MSSLEEYSKLFIDKYIIKVGSEVPLSIILIEFRGFDFILKTKRSNCNGLFEK